MTERQNEQIQLDDGTFIDEASLGRVLEALSVDNFIREHLINQEWWLVEHAWFLLLGLGDVLRFNGLPQPTQRPSNDDSHLLEILHAIDGERFKHKHEHRSVSVERVSFVSWARTEMPAIEWILAEWDGGDGSFAAAEGTYFFYFARLAQLWPEVRTLRAKRGRGGDQKSAAKRQKAKEAMEYNRELREKGNTKKQARSRTMKSFDISESTFYEWQSTTKSK